VPLFRRVAAINAVLLLLAVGATIAVLVPGRESSFRIEVEGVVLVVVIALVVVVNTVLLRRMVRPIQELTAFARDGRPERPENPGSPDTEPSSEAGELAVTFEEMLARLSNRAKRGDRARSPPLREAERLRIATGAARSGGSGADRGAATARTPFQASGAGGDCSRR